MSTSPPPTASVKAAPIGGNFKCSLHGIDTDDVNKWNEHCSDPKNNHTETGTTQCIGCNETLVFENIPFHKIDRAGSKNIQLRCDECDNTLKESYKNKSIRKVKNPSTPQAQQQQQQQTERKQPQ